MVKAHDVIPDIPVSDIDAARFTSAETGAHVQLVTENVTAALTPVLSLKVDDVEATHAEAVERGLDNVQPLTTESWGITRFFVRDPDGNVINITQHRE